MNVNDELERLTAEDLLDDVESWDVRRLRELRDACRESETRLSYRRRLAQGRLDIARAEHERRTTGGDLVDALPSILADRPTGQTRSDRAVALIDLEDDEEPEIDDIPLSRLPDLDDAELAALIEQSATEERELSRRRRALLDNLDRLQAELVTRYREGRADVDEVVSSEADAGA